MSAPVDDPSYRATQRGGPALRTDIVDVYVFRDSPRDPGDIEFLQMLRASQPMGGTWQPVMGHIEPGETAVDTALRELREEASLGPGSVRAPVRSTPDLLGVWALEQVHPFYIAAIECIVLSPRFAARVHPTWEPVLNHEHTASRWVALPRLASGAAQQARLAAALQQFMWPGQKATILEILREVVPDDSLSRDGLLVWPAR